MILVFKNKTDAEACLADIDTLLPSNAGCDRWADIKEVSHGLLKGKSYWFSSPKKRFPKIYKVVEPKHEFEVLEEVPVEWQDK